MNWLLNFFLLLSVCFLSASRPIPRDRSAPELYYETLGEVEKFLEEKYQLKAIGFGGKDFQEIDPKFKLTFEIRAPLSRDQLRKILLDASQDFLNMLNTKILPRNGIGIFTLQNIEISLFNNDLNGKIIYDPQIGAADIKDGFLYFRTFDSFKQYSPRTCHVETFEEALRLCLTWEKLLKRFNESQN